MTRAALEALQKRIERHVVSHLGGTHVCVQTFTESEHRERPELGRNRSYLKVRSVEVDEQNRRTRRNLVYGKTADRAETCTLIPVRANADWHVPLYHGLDHYWRWLPVMLTASLHGALDLRLGVTVGEETMDVDVNVRSDGFSMEMPTLEGDVREESVPRLEMPLIVSNVFEIVGTSEVPLVRAAPETVSVSERVDGE